MTTQPRAIDVHVHPSIPEYLSEAGGKYLESAAHYFKQKLEPTSIDQMASYYRERSLFGVLLGWDAETTSKCPPLSNDLVAEICRKHPDVFIGFAGVDPWKGKLAIEELERSIQELGLRGAKFQQAAQAFFPNDHRFYPFWELLQELEAPVLFHMGTTGYGAGAPGGLGVKLKYTQPIPYLDDVAADFPRLPIIGAHPAWPWVDEMTAVALHKANVYIDLSGWSPKYFPESLVRDMNSRLQDKCLFGSDYPFLAPDRWLKDFESLPLKDEVREKILFSNAQRLLKLP
ncbi:MAG: amidohydrolase [Deltaproteobacteria bacterium]|nr:amidohydrolase [Deltaproteobacteria bacterium]